MKQWICVVLWSMVAACGVARAAEAKGAAQVDFKGIGFGSAFKDFWATTEAPEPQKAFTGFLADKSLVVVGRTTVNPDALTDTVANIPAQITWMFVVKDEAAARLAAKVKQSIYAAWSGAEKQAVAQAQLAYVSVVYPAAKFEELRTAMIKKYGPSDSAKVRTMQDRRGRSFESRIEMWTKPELEIILEERNRSADRGSFSLKAPALMDAGKDVRSADL